MRLGVLALDPLRSFAGAPRITVGQRMHDPYQDSLRI